jgi:hypothetical protein
MGGLVRGGAKPENPFSHAIQTYYKGITIKDGTSLGHKTFLHLKLPRNDIRPNGTW